jgi:hypothetical protein
VGITLLAKDLHRAGKSFLVLPKSTLATTGEAARSAADQL